MEKEVKVIRRFELFEADGVFYVRDADAHSISAWGYRVEEAIHEFSIACGMYICELAEGRGAK